MRVRAAASQGRAGSTWRSCELRPGTEADPPLPRNPDLPLVGLGQPPRTAGTGRGGGWGTGPHGWTEWAVRVPRPQALPTPGFTLLLRPGGRGRDGQRPEGHWLEKGAKVFGVCGSGGDGGQRQTGGREGAGSPRPLQRLCWPQSAVTSPRCQGLH